MSSFSFSPVSKDDAQHVDAYALIAAHVNELVPADVAPILLGRIGDVLADIVPRDFESLALENAELRIELEQAESSDPLTGLRNRRQFFDDLRREFAAARRYDDALSVLVIDLENLDEVNAAHGFDAGDELLRTLAETLLTRLRVTDIAARIGGHTFAVIMPRTDADGADSTANRLPGEIGVALTIGAASIAPDTTSGAALIELADRNLVLRRARAAEPRAAVRASD